MDIFRKNVRKFRDLGISGLILLALFSLWPYQADALTVSPPIIEEVIERGVSLSRSILLYNETNQELLIRTEINEVEFDEANNTPLFTPTIIDPLAASNWIEAVPAPFILEPAARADLPISISVPQEAAPGSYGAAVIFTARPTTTDSKNIGVRGRTAVMMLITVPGEVRVEAELLGFELIDGGSGILPQAPQGLGMRIKNTGTVYFQPAAEVSVENLFGRESERIILNPNERRVLPGWTRTFEYARKPVSGPGAEWQPWALGPYRATLTVPVGDKVHTRTIRYWVMPWRTLGLAVVFAAILIILFSFRRKQREKRV